MGIDLDAKLNSLSSRSIDTQNTIDIAKQIFSNARTNETKSLSEQFDLSKFKKIDLGLEVYGKQITSEKATQIAIRQAGLDINVNQSVFTNVQYLNTQAAITQNKDLSKDVMGKIYAQVGTASVDAGREAEALPKSSNVFDVVSLGKDKHGSGMAMNYQAKDNKDGEPKEETQPLSIFA